MRVRVDLDVIEENARRLREMVDGEVTGVVKGVGAHREVVDALVATGIERIAVSRVPHLRKLGDLDAEVVMLRIPALSEVPDVVAAADVTLHGSRTAIEAANEEAERLGTTHRIVPMVDAGEGREGVALDRAEAFLEAIEGLDRVTFSAVGVNLGCFEAAPDPEAVRRVADALPDRALSVGGTGMVPIRDELPEAVVDYRVGDAFLTGKYVDRPIEGLRRGGVELRAEVLQRRGDEAVVDVGNVNSDPRHLVPRGDVTIERFSNEMAVISPAADVGETVAFGMEYDAIATTFNSRYV